VGFATSTFIDGGEVSWQCFYADAIWHTFGDKDNEGASLEWHWNNHTTATCRSGKYC